MWPDVPCEPKYQIFLHIRVPSLADGMVAVQPTLGKDHSGGIGGWPHGVTRNAPILRSI